MIISSHKQITHGGQIQMKTRHIIKSLMIEQNITNADMARKLGITSQAMWERTKSNCNKDIGTEQLAEILNQLGYKILLTPKDAPIPDRSYEVEINKSNHKAKKETIYTLTTAEGDVWKFDSKEEALRNKYIFGGRVKKEEVEIGKG